MLKVIGVRFPNEYHKGEGTGKTYYYGTNIEGIKKGDALIVPVGDNFQYAVAYASKYYGTQVAKDRVTRYVVDRINTENYKRLLEHVEKLAEIKEKMEERKRAWQEANMYELIATKDADMRKLLTEYKAMGEI